MDLMDRVALKTLIAVQAEVCVSIYLPTHRAGPDTQQDPIRFKNLLREAEERLSTFGLRSPEARGLLEPAQRLLTDLLKCPG